MVSLHGPGGVWKAIERRVGSREEQDALDILACLRKADRLDPLVWGEVRVLLLPPRGPRGTGVVGGERRHDVAVEQLQQASEELAPQPDVLVRQR